MPHRATLRYRPASLVSRLDKRQLLAIKQGSSLDDLEEINRLIMLHIVKQEKSHQP